MMSLGMLNFCPGVIAAKYLVQVVPVTCQRGLAIRRPWIGRPCSSRRSGIAVGVEVDGHAADLVRHATESICPGIEQWYTETRAMVAIRGKPTTLAQHLNASVFEGRNDHADGGHDRRVEIANREHDGWRAVELAVGDFCGH